MESIVKNNHKKNLSIAKKPLFFTFFLAVAILNVSAVPFFSGMAGAGLSFQPIPNAFLPELYTDAFFAGQFDISQNIIFRADVSVYTDNILGDNILKNTPAYFSLDEVSITYSGFLGTLSHYLSAFVGETDPIGSDLFLRRHFGIPAFGSKITETQRGITGAKIYPMSGIGASYVLRLPFNMASGVYLYYNKTTLLQNIPAVQPENDEENPEETEDPVEAPVTPVEPIIVTQNVDNESLNIDLRFAGAWPAITLDFAAGFTLPFEKTDSNEEKVILLIRRADLHTGISMLIGSSYTSSLLFQAGLIKLIFNPNEEEEEKVLAFKDVYILIEPRFVAKNVGFAFSLYNIPPEVSERLFYISNPLGVNVSIYSSNIQILGKPSQFGAHITLSVPESTIQITPDMLNLQVAPFATMNIGGGKLDAAVMCNVLGITNFNTFIQNTRVSIGYKVQL